MLKQARILRHPLKGRHGSSMKRPRPKGRSKLDLALVLTTSLCLCESVLTFPFPPLRQRSPALRKAAVQDVLPPSTSHAQPRLQPAPSPHTPIVERDFVVYRRPDAYDPLKGRRFIGSLQNFLQRVRDVMRDEREAKASRRKPSISRFVRACMEEKKYLTISTVALVGAAMCEVAVPHYSSKALNAILVTKKVQHFTTSVRAVVFLGLGASFFTFLRATFFGLAGTRVTTRSRIKLFKNLLSQELGFYDSTDTGELTNRLSADATRFYNVLASHFNVMLRQAIQAVGGSIYLYRIHPPLATVTLVGIFALAVMTTLHGTFIRRVGRRSQDALAKANAVANQILGLIRVVRCHGSEERELIRYGAALETTVNQLEGHDLGHAVYRSLVRVLQTFIQAVVMGVGSVLTLQGHMTGEQLTSFLFYTGFVGAASSDVGDRWGSIQDAVGSTQAVLSLMDRKSNLVVREDLRLPPSMNTTYDDAISLTHQESGTHEQHTTHKLEQEYSYGAVGGDVKAAQKGARVSFVNVSFTYPLRRSPVLHDFSLEIPSGQRTAIVGGSGAGKSTLMRLLCRFYDVDGGAVLLDGQDLRALTQEELTTKIAFLPQEPQLLPQMSIADNIGYGLPPGSFTMDDIVRAAREANVHTFISSLPHGYDTIVDEGAATLSGGQKQRISVARALIRKPELLLLDEPTSALDVKSEAVVQEALNLASTGRTVVIIAHRLSTIRNVENIVVMQGGRIVEMGNHEELMRSDDGVYASMVQLASGERVY